MLNLMTALGDSIVSPDDNRMFAEPTPMGTRHHPITHAAMWDVVSTQIHNMGLDIKQSQHALDKSGNRYFGLVEVGNGSDYFSDLIAFRSTHDQRFPIQVSGGSGVWICSNLCMGGSHKVQTKHTTNVMDRLPSVVAEGLTMAVERNALQAEQFEKYKLTRINRKTSNAAMTEMVRRDVIAANQLGKVIKEYDEPSHDEHKEDGLNVWRLFNAVTEAGYKSDRDGRSMVEILHKKSPKLMELCDQLVQVAA